MVADIKINKASMTIFTAGKISFLFKTYDMDSPELTSKMQLHVERLIRTRGDKGACAKELERQTHVSTGRNMHQYLALLIAKGYIFRRINPKRKNGYIYYSIQHLKEDEKEVPLKLTLDWQMVCLPR